MARRSPEDWYRLLEAQGWEDYAGLAKRLGVPFGTVAAGSKRAREWADRNGLANSGDFAKGSKVESGEPPKGAKTRQNLSLLSPQQEQALWLMVGPEPMTNTAIAEKVGVDRHTIGAWTRDPVFKVALDDIRTEKHDATVSALQGLAQEMVSHHGASARLTRLLVNEAIARMEEGPPDGADLDAAERAQEIKAWWSTTDTIVARAIEAGRLLNGSPIMAAGGYPKTERVVHAGKIDGAGLGAVPDPDIDAELEQAEHTMFEVIQGGR